MKKINELIDVICESIEKDFENNSVDELTIKKIKALADLVSARAM